MNEPEATGCHNHQETDPAPKPPGIGSSRKELSFEEAKGLIHRLQMNQIELERQNRELNATRQEIEETRRKYRDLYDFAPIGYFTLNEEGLITEVNLTGAEQLGAGKDYLIKKSFSDFIHREDRRQYLLHCSEVREKKTRRACELRVNRKDNSLFHAQIVSTSVDHGAGGHPFIRTALINVTERKLAEERLRASEHKYRRLVDNTLVGIYQSTMKGEVLFANEALVKMMEYASLEDLASQGALYFYQNNRERDLFIKDLKKQREIDNFERELTTRTGKVIHVLMSAALDGDTLSGMVMDISQRKEAEEELKKHREYLMELVSERTSALELSNALLREEISERIRAEEQVKRMALFAELNPSPVLRFDMRGNVLMANPSSRDVFGRQSLDGVPVRDLIPGTEAFDLGELIRRGAILSHPAQVGAQFFHFTIKGVPEMEIGQIYGSDITDQKKAEAETLRASHLASLGELAAGVAHEINNPINGIINYTQILANDTSPGSREYDIAMRIIKEGDRIAGIVANLLSLARDIREHKKTVHIHEILSDALALTETQLKKDGIKLKVSFSGEIPAMTVQPQHIEQVFLNIISNARYALNLKHPGAHDSKILEIGCEHLADGPLPRVRISFRDRGMGIPADKLDKVMNPFFSTKPSGSGTGLGLSISHGIITDHGGHISITSVEGEYTKVTIDLPAINSAGVADHEAGAQ
ncbi:MAG: PAS domain S-box protein [Nitrospiraceae bacterium]|nr:MAG: PAS domain S-box protein [Nitrospiraceae bacterium]